DLDDRLSITFERSWKADALRRDFTINAMSVDLDGNLYDYLGGLQDLRDQHIRFIGNYPEKIEADPVLILRFFKLLASFPDPKFDTTLFGFVKEHKCLVDQVKPKRVRRELQNIADGPSSQRVFTLMKQIGIDHCLRIAEDVQLPMNASDEDRLWAQIDPGDFREWLGQIVPREHKAEASQNPQKFKKYLMRYLAARVGYVPPANWGIQI